MCVFLSQLNITSFFNKLILTKVLGDYMVFKLGILHGCCIACILEPKLSHLESKDPELSHL